MRDSAPEIRRAGAEPVVVGNGKPPHAKRFRDSLGLDFPLLVDPEMKAYRAAGLQRTIWNTLGPRAWAPAFRAWRAGLRQHRTQGDPWQQGGAFVIAPGGHVRYSHVSRAAGDSPSPAHLVAKLRAG